MADRDVGLQELQADFFEDLPGVGLFGTRDVGRRPLRHNGSAAVAAFRSKVDDPIGVPNHIEVVFDDEHRIARLHEAIQHIE